LGRVKPFGGSVHLGDYLYPAYFEQETKTSPATPLDEVWNAFPQMTQPEVRAALARCGLKNEHITRPMNMLSGGEQAKVRLCRLMLQESNWILFDEPTNHLDVVAKEELKRALRAYKGAVLLVCHEPDFYQDWVTKVWNVEEWSSGRQQVPDCPIPGKTNQGRGRRRLRGGLLPSRLFVSIPHKQRRMHDDYSCRFFQTSGRA